MKSAKATSMRFTRVCLKNWRNFTAADAPLERRVFVVGPNAAGKSNLLDVFRFLHDLVSVGGGFPEAVRKRGGVSRLRSLAARRVPEIVIQVDLGDEAEPTMWSYELHFTQDNRQRPIVRKESASHLGTKIFERPEAPDLADPERLTQTYLEQVNVNKDYRAIADFFESIQYLHIVPQLVREPDRSVGRRDDPFGGDFLEQIARTPEKTRNARMRRVADALKVAVPQLKELEMHRDERGTPHLRGKYSHWRPHGVWQSEEQFSDGTLRLLGLLWSLLQGPGPLLLEEPELSLHPEVVRFVPQLFARMQRHRGRQIIVSTHSERLLQDEGIGMDEVLLLQPSSEGTTITLAESLPGVRSLLEGGVSMADAVLPRTRPEKAHQLTLFGE